MAWPDYQQLSARPVSFFELTANIRLLKTLRIVALLAALVALYLIGTRLSALPLLVHNVRIQYLQNIVAHSTLLSIIDQLFTGGSLSILSPFALGIFPLLLFEGESRPFRASKTNNRFKQWLIGGLVFVLGLALVMFWFITTGVLTATVNTISRTALYLILGSVLLVVINQQLIQHKGPGIIAINAIIIAYNYARTLLLDKHLVNTSIFVLIILFVASFVFLIRYTKRITLKNIRSEGGQGILPLPASNSSMRFFLLIITFIMLSIVTTLLNTFVGNTLSPFGDSLPDVLLFITVLVVIALAFISNYVIDSALSQFDSASTAHTLMLNYWLVSGHRVGDETAQFLRREAFRVHRLHYGFYLLWAILFSLVGLFAQLLHLPLTPLPFGPFGFLVTLTLCSELCYELYIACYRFVQHVRFGELWTPPDSRLANLQAFTESDTLEDMMQDMLEHIPPELREQFWSIRVALRSGRVHLADMKALLQLLRRITQQEPGEEVAIADVLLTIGKYLFFALVLGTVALFIVRFFLLRTAFSDVSTLVGVVISAVFAIYPLFFDATLQKFFTTLLHHPHSITFLHNTSQSTNSPATTLDVDHAFLVYDMLFTQQRAAIKRERDALQSDTHAAIMNMMHDCVGYIIDSNISTVTVTREQVATTLKVFSSWTDGIHSGLAEQITDREKLKQVLEYAIENHYHETAARFEQWLFGYKAQIPDRAIPIFYHSFSTTLTSLHALEQDIALWTIDNLWKHYADSLNAMRMRVSSQLDTQQAIEQFEQQADEQFEQLRLDIQTNIITNLFTILRRCLLTSITTSAVPATLPSPTDTPQVLPPPASAPLPQITQTSGTGTESIITTNQSPTNTESGE